MTNHKWKANPYYGTLRNVETKRTAIERLLLNSYVKVVNSHVAIFILYIDENRFLRSFISTQFLSLPRRFDNTTWRLAPSKNLYRGSFYLL